MEPDWARDVRDQCREAGAAFFLKQMWKRQAIPADLMVREYPAL
jgi:protein gp37